MNFSSTQSIDHDSTTNNDVQENNNLKIPISKVDRVGLNDMRRRSSRRPSLKSSTSQVTMDTKTSTPNSVPISKSRNGSTRNSAIPQDQDDHDNLLINSCAITLATLDKRACARAQLKDANAILEQFLLPMSLPWSHHKELLYKTVPRDIDEMPSIIDISDDDIEHEFAGDGNEYSANVSRLFPTSTARSSDPGVKVLRTYTDPSTTRSKRFVGRHQDPRAEDPMLPGELSLRMYYETQGRKRKRDEYENSFKQIKHISFRVGSTSSRASIFDTSDQSKDILFLLATYPKLVQDGIKRNGLDAYEFGTNLGSYNSRPLPAKSSVIDNPTCKNRFVVGRTRLIWSEKERPESSSQRSAYRSITTGLRLEPSALKRPLDVKVAIRINGVLLSSSQSQQHATNALKPKIVNGRYSYPLKVVLEALSVACKDDVTTLPIKNDIPVVAAPQDYSQCVLNTTKFVADIIRGTTSNGQTGLVTNISNVTSSPISIHRRVHIQRQETPKNGAIIPCQVYRIEKEHETSSETHSLHRVIDVKLQIVPPRFECLPTEDGLIHVSCSHPGKITFDEAVVNDYDRNTITVPPISSLMLNILASETFRCVICWYSDTSNDRPTSDRRSTDDHQSSWVHCIGCNVNAHRFCVSATHDKRDNQCKSLSDDKSPWICPNCKPATCNRTCHVCNISGGNMIPFLDGHRCIHHICKTWCDIDINAAVKPLRTNQHHTTNYDQNGSNHETDDTILYITDPCCDLCSNGSDTAFVVPCYAEGCSVRFHPMCAMVASASYEIQYVKNKHSSNNSQVQRRTSMRSMKRNHKDYTRDDTYLCTQYTLSTIKTKFVPDEANPKTNNGSISNGSSGSMPLSIQPSSRRLSISLASSSSQSNVDHQKHPSRATTNPKTKNGASVSKNIATNSIALHTDNKVTRQQQLMEAEKLREQQLVLPIAFCPYHNPQRLLNDHYGLYPNAQHMNETNVRIPPRRTMN